MVITIPATELLAATYFAEKSSGKRNLLKKVFVICDKWNEEGTSYKIVCTDSIRLVEFSGKAK